MHRTFKQHTLLMFLGMLIYSGCAKQPLVPSDNLMGGHLPAATQTGITSVNPKVTPAPEKPVSVTASSASTIVTNEAPKASNVSDSATTVAALQYSLQKIYFDFDSSKLSVAARQKLAENYEILKKSTAIQIRIEGNCDERGSDEYNLALGERRAKAAARYLTTLGIPNEQLLLISFGKEKPADPSHDESAWKKNRRDEFVITSR